MTYLEHLYDKFDFGKFKGCSLGEILMSAPNYLYWVVENVSEDMCVITDSAITEITQVFPKFQMSYEFEIKRRMKQSGFECRYPEDNECPIESYKETYSSYNEYNGFYVQDEMYYSDDDIDTIFEGDPYAYWNID